MIEMRSDRCFDRKIIPFLVFEYYIFHSSGIHVINIRLNVCCQVEIENQLIEGMLFSF